MASIDVEYLQLVSRHQPTSYGYIRSLAPGADIEDILQETNLVLWEKSASFQPGSNFKAFAFRIAHFKTLEALRSERRRHWLVFDTEPLESIAERQAAADSLADGQQAALRQCLLPLSPEILLFPPSCPVRPQALPTAFTPKADPFHPPEECSSLCHVFTRHDNSGKLK